MTLSSRLVQKLRLMAPKSLTVLGGKRVLDGTDCGTRKAGRRQQQRQQQLLGCCLISGVVIEVMHLTKRNSYHKLAKEKECY